MAERGESVNWQLSLPALHRQRYWVHVRIVGSSVELHARQSGSGDRFISRAEDWDVAESELSRLVARYGRPKPRIEGGEVAELQRLWLHTRALLRKTLRRLCRQPA